MFNHAYVFFKEIVESKRFLENHRFPKIGGVICRTSAYRKERQKPKEADLTEFTLFVKNLPHMWTHADLYEVAKEYGSIVGCKVFVDEHYKSRGYGRLQFEQTEGTKKAIEGVSEFDHFSLQTLVEWKGH